MTDKNNGAVPANALPMFYTKPAPLDSQKHAKLGMKTNFGLEFTNKINAVPVNLIEMPQICHAYPIAFSPDGNATPVAILGLRDSENLFVNSKGKWEEGLYVPAYIRRYPFIFSEVPGKEQLSLCVDMNDKIVNEKADQKFFDDKNEPTPLTQNALEFCKSYHAAAQQTLEFSKWLAESGLLIEREAQINVGNKSRINFSGFRIVDEQKLRDLPADQVAELHKKGWLAFIYAHLFSGVQWQRLSRMLAETMEKQAA